MGTPPEVFVRESDAFAWHMEADPILRSTVVSVAWLAAPPDWEALVARLDAATRAVPVFRMRLAAPPLRLAPPRWVPDPEFDLHWHLRRVDAPSPYTARTVLDLARVAAMASFDPARPLWEFTLVEGVEGDRAAFIMKVHHSLIDGLGGMRLSLLLFDPSVDAELCHHAADGSPADGEPPSTAALLRDAVAHDARRVLGAAASEVRSAPAAAAGLVRHPLRTVSGAGRLAASVSRMVAPVMTTLSPLVKDRGTGRELDLLAVRLADLKQAAAVAGGTVNDAYLAAVTGGLRRYHEVHGATAGELRMTFPISIRTDADPDAGNRITLQRITLPAGIRDPAVRIRAIHGRCRAMRDEPAIAHSNAVAGALNLLPPAVIGTMLKHVDFLASDVPGLPFPIFLAGAEVTSIYPFGPTIGASVNTTLLSYNGTCCVGITIDTAAFPDPSVLTECLAEGFDEVLRLAGNGARCEQPLHDEAGDLEVFAEPFPATG